MIFICKGQEFPNCVPQALPLWSKKRHLGRKTLFSFYILDGTGVKQCFLTSQTKTSLKGKYWHQPILTQVLTVRKIVMEKITHFHVNPGPLSRWQLKERIVSNIFNFLECQMFFQELESVCLLEKKKPRLTHYQRIFQPNAQSFDWNCFSPRITQPRQLLLNFFACFWWKFGQKLRA